MPSSISKDLFLLILFNFLTCLTLTSSICKILRFSILPILTKVVTLLPLDSLLIKYTLSVVLALLNPLLLFTLISLNYY